MRSIIDKPKASPSKKSAEFSKARRSDPHHADIADADGALRHRIGNQAVLRLLDAHPAARDSLRSPGQPLDTSTRAFMESRLGHDLSLVRLHTGREACKGAAAMSARAFTVGNDIVLGTDEHTMRTPEGRHLLAHELTHTLQQRSGARPANAMSAPGDAFERQADSVADAVAGGHSARPLLDGLRPTPAAPASFLMRQTEPRPNPAEFAFVPIVKGGTWDALSILDRISQREYTETRIAKSQPAAGTESDPYRCGPSAVLASAIVAGPKAVAGLCVNLYRRIIEWRALAEDDDKSFDQKRRDARRAGTDPDAVQKSLPFKSVCEKAAKKIFDIHWNLETGIRFGTHEGGGCILTFADLDELSNYLYMFSFDAKTEWRRDAEAVAKAASIDELKPDVRSRVEPVFKKRSQQRERERADNPALGELTWRQFGNYLNYRARFRTESEISDAAMMAGYDTAKSNIIKNDLTLRYALDMYLDRLKPGDSILAMWGPHTYTFFCIQEEVAGEKRKEVYLYDSWRNAVDEKAKVLEFLPAQSVHRRGSPEFESRVQNGLTGRDSPMTLLLNEKNKLHMY